MEFHKILRYSFVISSIAALAACSSADSGTSGTTTPPTAVTVNGTIFASNVNGATVTVKDSSGNVVAGPVTTTGTGTYSISMLNTDLDNDLLFESNDGLFDDEASGDIGVQAGAMSAYVTGGTLANGDNVHVTPGTTITAELVTKHRKTPAQAQTSFFNAFAYNPDISIEPVDVTMDAALTADDDSRHIGWRAAVFSQLAKDLGLAPAEQFDMFEAIAQDLSDDTLDGSDADGAVKIGTTGVTLPGSILNDYVTLTGSYNVANSATYEVTYTPPSSNVHGKNQFTLTVMDTSTTPAVPVENLVSSGSLKVMPMMYMADRMHSTPMGDIVDQGNGVYQVTIYYLMPSRMMDGTTMGTWDLKVMVGTESVHFYPNINMAMMNNTARVQLKGVNDTIIDMNGLEVPRNYNLFRDNLVQTGPGGDYQLDIFIAPMETMMSFPALEVPMELQSGMGGTPYDVTDVSIDVKVGNGPWQMANGTPNGVGIWSLTGLNLSGGSTNNVHVRLTVSGEVKTTDGLPVNTDPLEDPNDFATFKVTLP